jgi:hypothetical protein
MCSQHNVPCERHHRQGQSSTSDPTKASYHVLRDYFVAILFQDSSEGRKLERADFPIERGVADMDRPVVVGADEHEVVEFIVSATAEPADVVSLAEIGPED